ncbi:MAG: c-type cytochrome [Planctomycetes bacterium]|nr:c-type cytochrome [Planctomycetota bacterium]
MYVCRSIYAPIAVAIAICSTALAQDGPRPVAEAAAAITVPEGFKVTLFAGEPDIVQPIAMAFDDRGRLWVVECYSYPNWSQDGTGRDRVVILEDRDHDGRHDTRTVFLENGSNLSGIELGFGGVWLCSAPNLIFVPDKNGDDKPDGPAEVLLDGWDCVKTKHNVFNSLGWGPDGWLWGCNGIQAESLIGRPGTPEAERTAMNCGVWRYHPTDKRFEVVASGTTNPWGLDWDEYGEAFITNCVIKHLFHVIPGAHYDRMYGQDVTPHTYGLLPSCADHIHWGGGNWTDSRGGKGSHDVAGGGHAHVGCCVYLGTNFPAEYRNSVLMCNLHGNRLNRDLLEPNGSTYTAKHGPDFLHAHDEWFRGLVVKYGPDGGLYVSDWTDTGECHNYKQVDLRNGRIYKVVYGTPKYEAVDWAKQSLAQLMQLVIDTNEWNSRQARLKIQERVAARKVDPTDWLAALPKEAEPEQIEDRIGLRLMWAMSLGDLPWMEMLIGTANSTPRTRAWAVRLETNHPKIEAETVRVLTQLAGRETEPQVRLALASALQRILVKDRLPLAKAMVARAEDADDPALPLMIWYGVEPLAAQSVAQACELIEACKIPLVRQNIVRRLVERDEKSLAEILPPLVGWLAIQKDANVARDVLGGMANAWRGRRTMPMPGEWSKLKSAPFERDQLIDWLELQVASRLGDAESQHRLLVTLLTRDAPVERRLLALAILQEIHYGPLGANLPQLLSDRTVVRGAAVRALSAIDDPEVPFRLLVVYAELDDDERADVINTLASRAKYATVLLDAVTKQRIAKGDVPLTVVRQLKAFKQPEIDKSIEQIWGALRPPSKDKQELKSRYQSQLTADLLAKADLSHGRQLFAKSCAACHVLFDTGKRIGPELTGSQRSNLDYVLDNVLDPSAAVARDYQMTQLVLNDGRLLTGIVAEETDQTLTLQTTAERLVLAKSDIDERARSPLSMMPEGLFNALSPDDVRDLVGYLASPQQVPLPDAPPE